MNFSNSVTPFFQLCSKEWKFQILHLIPHYLRKFQRPISNGLEMACYFVLMEFFQLCMDIFPTLISKKHFFYHLTLSVTPLKISAFHLKQCKNCEPLCIPKPSPWHWFTRYLGSLDTLTQWPVYTLTVYKGCSGTHILSSSRFLELLTGLGERDPHNSKKENRG